MADGADPLLASRLERGEVVLFPACPFPLPEGDNRRFLLEQPLDGRAHKDIRYDPHTGRTAGFQRCSADQAAHLHKLLAHFSQTASAWLAATLPRYAAAWKLN